MLSIETFKIAVPAINRYSEVIKRIDFNKQRNNDPLKQHNLSTIDFLDKELSGKLQQLFDNENQELLNILDERINKAATSLEDKIRQNTIFNLKIYDELREKLSNQEKVINENKGEKLNTERLQINQNKLFEDNKQLRQELRQELQEQNNKQKINFELLHEKLVEQQHEKLQRQQINHEQLQEQQQINHEQLQIDILNLNTKTQEHFKNEFQDYKIIQALQGQEIKAIEIRLNLQQEQFNKELEMRLNLQKEQFNKELEMRLNLQQEQFENELNRQLDVEHDELINKIVLYHAFKLKFTTDLNNVRAIADVNNMKNYDGFDIDDIRKEKDQFNTFINKKLWETKLTNSQNRLNVYSQENPNGDVVFDKYIKSNPQLFI
jgi:hypothetical protein